MKFRLLYTSLFFLSVSFSVSADVDLDEQNFGTESIKEADSQTPFSFQTHFDYICSAKVKNGPYKGDKIVFAEAENLLNGVLYYNPAFKEGVRLGLGYTATYLHWEDNPMYDQDRYRYLSVNFSGFTERYNNWFWRTQISANIDTDQWSGCYTNYDVVLWGRYAYCKHIGIHIGFWALTGMDMNFVYPIIGADWQISPKWKLNLVYPVNISLQYALTSSWSFAIAGRNFDTRRRLNKNSAYSKGLIHYQNIGAEVAFIYEKRGVSANIHAGTTLGGRYRIADKHNHHARKLHLEPSPYFGAEMDVSF